MTNYSNDYIVIPVLHIETGKTLYSVMQNDGHSYPESGLYTTKAAANAKANELNSKSKGDINEKGK